MSRAYLTVICFLCVTGCILPPGQPETGYGSYQEYICDGVSIEDAISFGQYKDGTKVWVFVPDILKNSTSAPVVIYLHGYSADSPLFYMGHINHLVKQGVIVIFPLFNLASIKGFLTDLDQNLMIERAIQGVQNALLIPEIADIAELENITIASHSLGGMLSLCWQAKGGVPVKNMVLLHPNISNDAIPDIVEQYFTITTLDFETFGAATTCPVIIVGGADDTIAKPEHVRAAFDSLVNASSRVYYEVQTDKHGFPNICSYHTGPMQYSMDSDKHTFRWRVMEDAVDFRVYYAAVDAAVDSRTYLEFDMGEWSDGTLVTHVRFVDGFTKSTDSNW